MHIVYFHFIGNDIEGKNVGDKNVWVSLHQDLFEKTDKILYGPAFDLDLYSCVPKSFSFVDV